MPRQISDKNGSRVLRKDNSTFNSTENFTFNFKHAVRPQETTNGKELELPAVCMLSEVVPLPYSVGFLDGCP